MIERQKGRDGSLLCDVHSRRILIAIQGMEEESNAAEKTSDECPSSQDPLYQPPSPPSVMSNTQPTSNSSTGHSVIVSNGGTQSVTKEKKHGRTPVPRAIPIQANMMEQTSQLELHRHGRATDHVTREDADQAIKDQIILTFWSKKVRKHSSN